MAIDQEDRNLCKAFCPEMFTDGTKTCAQFVDLKLHFEGKCIEEDFQLYNILEKTILELDLSSAEEERVEEEKMKI
jgi:hypothetical protein